VNANYYLHVHLSNFGWIVPMRLDNGAALGAVLDLLNVAVFVVDADRKTLHANTAASASLAVGHPFHLDQLGCLRLDDMTADKAFKDGIHALRRAQAVGKMGVMPVQGRGASPTMFAWISALPLCAEADGVVCVMLTERSRCTVEKEILADLFGLTAAESRLVYCLLQGLSPSQYAAQQDLSQNTVRNQLKSIFEKTDVRRQSDLISLAWNVLAPVNFNTIASISQAGVKQRQPVS
jgi:DNA-binding CsgD family transcriptional regulator